MTWEMLIICFCAGAAAGIGTGFAGMSAAAVIAPILATFLKIPIYDAIGIGLLSDVMASAISAYTYKKNNNLDIKNSIILMITILILTIIGSFVASYMPEQSMNNTMQIAMIIIGLRFIIKPVTTPKEKFKNKSKRKLIIQSILGGIFIGFICGFVGAGGGMMMLFVLTTFLGYPLHMAVGTSVFIMSFTALTGGISHFAISGLPNINILLLCVIFTLLWALIASKIANKSKPIILNRVVGIILIITSLIILFVNYL